MATFPNSRRLTSLGIADSLPRSGSKEHPAPEQHQVSSPHF
jgi:hypothetical protein